MPLYAYIKIPGITNSESTDETYGKEWIPLTSIDFRGTAESSDEDLGKAKESRDNRRRLERLMQGMESARSKGSKIPDFVFSEIKKLQTCLMQSILESKGYKKQKEQTAGSGDDGDDFNISDMDDLHDMRESGSSLTIRKMLDATSPALHLKCLECGQYESNEYIKDKIEIHICHVVPGACGTGKGGSDREAYMAFVLENCLITQVSVDASENSKLEEVIKISFEKIHYGIKPASKNWDIKGWDFLDEKEVSETKPADP